MRSVRFLFEILHGELRGLLIRDMLLILTEGVLAAAALLTVAPVIELFLATQQPSPIVTRLTTLMRSVGLPVSLGSCLAVFLAAAVLKNGFAVLVRRCLLQTRFAVLQSLVLGTWSDFFGAQWAFFSGGKHGTILNTLLHETTTVASAGWMALLLLTSLLQMAFYIAVPLYVSWQVTCISVGLAGVFAIPFLWLGRVNYHLGKVGIEATNHVAAVVQESLSLAKIILGFGHQQQQRRALERAVETQCRTARRSLTLQAAIPLLYEPFGLVALVITVFAGQWVGIPLSEVAVLFWALRNCVPLLNTVMTCRNTLLNAAPSYEQITSLRRRARELKQPSGTRRFTGFRDGITLERLAFAYPDHEPVLADITLSIPKGKMVALVGESGVGKSTLIDLLMGFYQPTSGRIAVDGIPLRDFDIQSYRQRIGYVPQESVLFNATILDNLRWAKPDATDEDIRQACRQAHADEFIERFSNGYHTEVGERGVRLSGGQCQRVALARAILREPELLILDEATSSLDTQSERLIQQAIEAVAKDATVVVVAHRLSTIINADSIYVLQGGRVVEEGTYQGLVRQAGYFSRMTRLQVLEPVA